MFKQDCVEILDASKKLSNSDWLESRMCSKEHQHLLFLYPPERNLGNMIKFPPRNVIVAAFWKTDYKEVRMGAGGSVKTAMKSLMKAV